MPTRKITVFPYSSAFAPYTTTWASRLLANSEMEISHIVAPHGYAFHGKDCGEIDRRGAMGFIVENDFAAALCDSDVLLLAEGLHTQSLRIDIVQKAVYSAQIGKDIFCAFRLSAQEETVIRKACDSGHTSFSYVFDLPQVILPTLNSLPIRSNELQPISMPIVLVAEVMDNLNGIDMTLALWDHFLCKGYRSTIIMPAGTASFMGAHNIESFYSNEGDLYQQIRSLNHSVGQLEYQTETDLFIIKVPGNVMAITDEVSGDFGVNAYLLSQAIAVDCCLLCVPYGFINKEVLYEYEMLLKYRYSWPLDGIHMSNAMLDITYIQEMHEMSCAYLSLEKAIQTVIDINNENDTGVAVFNSLQRPELLCKMIEEKLCNYGVASAIM